jgi:hypothetical protein
MNRRTKGTKTPRELTALEYAKERGVSLDWIYKQARQGKIPGARRIDGRWAIPAQPTQTRQSNCGAVSVEVRADA